jgi:hypothetical protein
MKQFLLAFLLVLATGTAAAQGKQRFGDNAKPVNPADYPLTVHVSHAFLSGALNELRLDTVVHGKKLQLESQGPSGLLHVGDYKARVVKDDEKKGGWFYATYELLLPDGTHWFFNVVAETE